MKKLLLFITSLLMFTACYYDKYDELYPFANYTNDCDTTLADTYSASVSLVISNNCISCHNKTNKSGNIDLSDYSNVASSANSGKLMGTIQRSPGYKAMPPNSSLQQCEIDRIQRWLQLNLPQ